MWVVPAIYRSYLGQTAGSGGLLVHPGGFRWGGCGLVPRGGFWAGRGRATNATIWVVGTGGWQLPIPIGQGILTVVVLVV